MTGWPDLIALAERELALVRSGDTAALPAAQLSHGDQRSLEIATALAVNSRLLLLDEPTAGLSPSETKTAVELIKRIAAKQGLTVLFVEHDMEVVAGADWVIDLGPGGGVDGGRVVAAGTPASVARAPGSATARYLALALGMA